MLRRLGVVGAFVSIAACAKQEAKVDTTAATAAAQPNVVTVTTKDFAFESPDTIPGGLTTIVLKNHGPNLHHVQLIRLPDGRSVADLANGLKRMKPGDPLPAWAVTAGGVNSPVPGGESSATLVIEPGNYGLMCFIDTPDHVPHFAKGMIKGLTVTAAPAVTASPPDADVTLTLNDYSFTFSPPLTAGHRVLKVDNVASQAHEVFLFKLAPGKTADDLSKWAGTYKGEPPGMPVGGTTGLMMGMTHYVPLDLTAGNYVAICFLPDAKDGQPHTRHGMILSFTVN